MKDEVDQKATHIVKQIFDKILNMIKTDPLMKEASIGYTYAGLLAACMQIEEMIGKPTAKKIRDALFMVKGDDIKSYSCESCNTKDKQLEDIFSLMGGIQWETKSKK